MPVGAQELRQLGRLRGLERLCGLQVCAPPSALSPLSLLSPCLSHLELSLMHALVTGVEGANDGAEGIYGPGAQLPDMLASLTSLTRLELWDWPGSPTLLLHALSGLPHLGYLGLFGVQGSALDAQHVGLLAGLTALRTLAVDRLAMMGEVEEAQWPTHLTALEVGLSITSYQRLPVLFPGVQRVQLKWLWSSALRKCAGWGSVRALELSNLQYAEDWRLLRTLQYVTHLSLSRGVGLAFLASVLDIAAGLTYLTHLSLSVWELAPREAHIQAASEAAPKKVPAWLIALQEREAAQQAQQGRAAVQGAGSSAAGGACAGTPAAAASPPPHPAGAGSAQSSGQAATGSSIRDAEQEQLPAATLSVLVALSRLASLQVLELGQGLEDVVVGLAAQGLASDKADSEGVTASQPARPAAVSQLSQLSQLRLSAMGPRVTCTHLLRLLPGHTASSCGTADSSAGGESGQQQQQRQQQQEVLPSLCKLALSGCCHLHPADVARVMRDRPHIDITHEWWPAEE